MKQQKKLTFSFDDGVRQDSRLIEILNRYGLKATFNLNSARFGENTELSAFGKTIPYCRCRAEEVCEIYRGHEVAAHTLTHQNLTQLSDADVIFETEKDRLALSELCGYEVIGMAYPCGGINNDERTAALIRDHTGIRYARTITSSGSFQYPANLLRLDPTVQITDLPRATALADRFLALPAEQPAIFYIWGHSYEFDLFDSWDSFELFCKKVAGHEEIAYCTNREALLGENN